MLRNTPQCTLILVLSFIATSVSADEDPERLVEVAVLEGIAGVACSDEQLLDTSGLAYENCVELSRSLAPICWESMRPALIDLHFGQNEFGSTANQHRFRAAMFMLENCVKSLVLLPDNRGIGEQLSKIGSEEAMETVSSDGPADNVSDESFHDSRDGSGTDAWAEFSAMARSDYIKNVEPISLLFDTMATSDVDVVSITASGEAVRLKRDNEGILASLPGGSELWEEALEGSDVRVASKNSDGAVILHANSELITDKYRIGVSYDLDLKDEYSPCTPLLQLARCGSCELGRTMDHRAVLTWFSRDIDYGKQLASDKRHEASMQCWEEGMAQLRADD